MNSAIEEAFARGIDRLIDQVDAVLNRHKVKPGLLVAAGHRDTNDDQVGEALAQKTSARMAQER